jgi:hypothetical protein
MRFEVHVTVQENAECLHRLHITCAKVKVRSNPGTTDLSVKRLGFGTRPMQTLRLKTAHRNVKRVLLIPKHLLRTIPKFQLK